jgi:hypothetical protein
MDFLTGLPSSDLSQLSGITDTLSDEFKKAYIGGDSATVNTLLEQDDTILTFLTSTSALAHTNSVFTKTFISQNGFRDIYDVLQNVSNFLIRIVARNSGVSYDRHVKSYNTTRSNNGFQIYIKNNTNTDIYVVFAGLMPQTTPSGKALDLPSLYGLNVYMVMEPHIENQLCQGIVMTASYLHAQTSLFGLLSDSSISGSHLKRNIVKSELPVIVYNTTDGPQWEHLQLDVSSTTKHPVYNLGTQIVHTVRPGGREFYMPEIYSGRVAVLTDNKAPYTAIPGSVTGGIEVVTETSIGATQNFDFLEFCAVFTDEAKGQSPATSAPAFGFDITAVDQFNFNLGFSIQQRSIPSFLRMSANSRFVNKAELAKYLVHESIQELPWSTCVTSAKNNCILSPQNAFPTNLFSTLQYPNQVQWKVALDEYLRANRFPIISYKAPGEQYEKWYFPTITKGATPELTTFTYTYNNAPISFTIPYDNFAWLIGGAGTWGTGSVANTTLGANFAKFVGCCIETNLIPPQPNAADLAIIMGAPTSISTVSGKYVNIINTYGLNKEYFRSRQDKYYMPYPVGDVRKPFEFIDHYSKKLLSFGTTFYTYTYGDELGLANFLSIVPSAKTVSDLYTVIEVFNTNTTLPDFTVTSTPSVAGYDAGFLESVSGNNTGLTYCSILEPTMAPAQAMLIGFSPTAYRIFRYISGTPMISFRYCISTLNNAMGWIPVNSSILNWSVGVTASLPTIRADVNFPDTNLYYTWSMTSTQQYWSLENPNNRFVAFGASGKPPSNKVTITLKCTVTSVIYPTMSVTGTVQIFYNPNGDSMPVQPLKFTSSDAGSTNAGSYQFGTPNPINVTVPVVTSGSCNITASQECTWSCTNPNVNLSSTSSTTNISVNVLSVTNCGPIRVLATSGNGTFLVYEFYVGGIISIDPLPGYIINNALGSVVALPNAPPFVPSGSLVVQNSAYPGSIDFNNGSSNVSAVCRIAGATGSPTITYITLTRTFTYQPIPAPTPTPIPTTINVQEFPQLAAFGIHFTLPNPDYHGTTAMFSELYVNIPTQTANTMTLECTTEALTDTYEGNVFLNGNLLSKISPVMLYSDVWTNDITKTPIPVQNNPRNMGNNWIFYTINGYSLNAYIGTFTAVKFRIVSLKFSYDNKDWRPLTGTFSTGSQIYLQAVSEGNVLADPWTVKGGTLSGNVLTFGDVPGNVVVTCADISVTITLIAKVISLTITSGTSYNYDYPYVFDHLVVSSSDPNLSYVWTLGTLVINGQTFSVNRLQYGKYTVTCNAYTGSSKVSAATASYTFYTGTPPVSLVLASTEAGYTITATSNNIIPDLAYTFTRPRNIKLTQSNNTVTFLQDNYNKTSATIKCTVVGINTSTTMIVNFTSSISKNLVVLPGGSAPVITSDGATWTTPSGISQTTSGTATTLSFGQPIVSSWMSKYVITSPSTSFNLYAGKLPLEITLANNFNLISKPLSESPITTFNYCPAFMSLNGIDTVWAPMILTPTDLNKIPTTASVFFKFNITPTNGLYNGTITCYDIDTGEEYFSTLFTTLLYSSKPISSVDFPTFAYAGVVCFFGGVEFQGIPQQKNTDNFSIYNSPGLLSGNVVKTMAQSVINLNLGTPNCDTGGLCTWEILDSSNTVLHNGNLDDGLVNFSLKHNDGSQFTANILYDNSIVVTKKFSINNVPVPSIWPTHMTFSTPISPMILTSFVSSNTATLSPPVTGVSIISGNGTFQLNVDNTVTSFTTTLMCGGLSCPITYIKLSPPPPPPSVTVTWDDANTEILTGSTNTVNFGSATTLTLTSNYSDTAWTVNNKSVTSKTITIKRKESTILCKIPTFNAMTITIVLPIVSIYLGSQKLPAKVSTTSTKITLRSASNLSAPVSYLWTVSEQGFDVDWEVGKSIDLEIIGETPFTVTLKGSSNGVQASVSCTFIPRRKVPTGESKTPTFEIVSGCALLAGALGILYQTVK